MLLRIRNLQTHFISPAGIAPAVDGVSLEIPLGKTVALVGESGRKYACWQANKQAVPTTHG